MTKRLGDLRRASLAVAIAAVTVAAGAPAGLAAQAGGTTFTEASAASESLRSDYIILLKGEPLATYSGGLSGLPAPETSTRSASRGKLNARGPASQAYVRHLDEVQTAFVSSASSLLGRSLQTIYRYHYALNGMAMSLTPSEAQQIAAMPDVASVHKSEMLKLATDSGPAWIGAPGLWDGSATGGVAGTQGEGIVVGVLDTGINFDSPSFAATGSDDYSPTNPLGAGTYLGTCADGGMDAGKCNGKLIGAYSYIDSLPSGSPDVLGTATDHAGHGSHTSSTAAGNHALATTSDGAQVAVSGVAPHANLIMYKVCFAPPPNYSDGTCTNTSSAAAADQAVADGVDAINFSISGGRVPWDDAVSIAFRNAAAAGIFVATAAGNTANGDPNPAQPGTVNHLEPWTIAVGAASHDRLYSNAHVTVDGLGELAGVKGILYDSSSILTGPVSGPLAVTSDPLACTAVDALPAGSVALIQRGTCNFSVKINNAGAAGAVAVVIYDNLAEAPFIMSVPGTTLPAIMVSKTDGEAIRSLLESGGNNTAELDLTTPPSFTHDAGFGDIMAKFSLLGPAGGTAAPLDLLKPDIAAPGVSILGAAEGAADHYEFYQGTSMAAPHVAGSGALLRALHPDWTAMEIKSALMLTAKAGMRKFTATELADPFDTGAGRVDLTRASTTPLVMDETIPNMVAANPADGGDLAALNLPSLSDARCAGTCTFTRVFRNPTSQAQTFAVSVVAADGSVLSGSASPATFTVAAGATQAVSFTVDAGGVAENAYAFGEVQLMPQSGDALTMPVAVRNAAPLPAAVSVTPAALSADLAPGETASQTLTISNSGGEELDWSIAEEPVGGSVVLSNDTLSGTGKPAGSEVSLQIDQGLGHNVIGVGPGHPILWLNRFTPAATDFPFTLREVSLQFIGELNGGGHGAVIGEHFDVYVYQDDDDNPSNGAQLLGSVTGVAVDALDDVLQTVEIPEGIEVAGPGDVLIAIAARDATGGSPATGDEGPSVGRSWIANPSTIGSPPDLAATGLVHVEDALSTFSRNFVLRGRGERGAGGICSAPSDVPWLSVSPASGTVAAGGSGTATVTFDATDLAAGEYHANLCLTSNDPAHALVAVPVSMTVAAAAGDCATDDTIFCDGFDSGSGGTFTQPIQDPSFEETDGSGDNPYWDGSDSASSIGRTPFYENFAHTGTHIVWCGGWGSSSTQTWSQTVAIASGGPRYLKYWREIAAAPAAPATFTVRVDGQQVEAVDLAAAGEDADFAQFSVDVSAYADDAEHSIEFECAQTGDDDGNTFIDDITIEATKSASIRHRASPGQAPRVVAGKRND